MIWWLFLVVVEVGPVSRGCGFGIPQNSCVIIITMMRSLRRRPDLCRVFVSRGNRWSQQRFSGDSSSSSSSTSPPTPKNNDDYFHLFRIPRAFSIDEGQLKQQYRSLMKELHPDVNNSNKSSDDAASSVTHAYETLRHPHLRASHLMALLGRPLDEGSNKSVSADFLMHMVEWREQVANVDPDVDVDADGKLRELLRQAASAMDQTGQQLQRAIDEDDFSTAHRCTGELQYWNRLIETLREAMPQQ